MSTLARLLGEIAADLDDALGTIEEGLRSLRECTRESESSSGILERSLDAVHRGYRLSGELRDIGRGTPLRSRPTDVNPLILTVADRVHESLPGTVETRVRMNGRIGTAHTDLASLRDVLLALGSGIAASMPRHGWLTWETRIDTLHDGDARRLGSAPGPQVAIEIRAAAAPGEPPLDLSHLAWSRRSGPLRSCGLGRDLEGSLDVSMSRSGGVAVRVYLPPSLEDETS
jgi:hypothetical protein